MGSSGVQTCFEEAMTPPPSRMFLLVVLCAAAGADALTPMCKNPSANNPGKVMANKKCSGLTDAATCVGKTWDKCQFKWFGDRCEVVIRDNTGSHTPSSCCQLAGGTTSDVDNLTCDAIALDAYGLTSSLSTGTIVDNGACAATIKSFEQTVTQYQNWIAGICCSDGVSCCSDAASSASFSRRRARARHRTTPRAR